MTPIEELDRIAIDVKSHRLLKTLLKENPKLDEIMRNSKNEIEARIGLRDWVMEELRQRPQALAYYEGSTPTARRSRHSRGATTPPSGCSTTGTMPAGSSSTSTCGARWR
jgi:hypothetical protein